MYFTAREGNESQVRRDHRGHRDHCLGSGGPAEPSGGSQFSFSLFSLYLPNERSLIILMCLNGHSHFFLLPFLLRLLLPMAERGHGDPGVTQGDRGSAPRMGGGLAPGWVGVFCCGL